MAACIFCSNSTEPDNRRASIRLVTTVRSMAASLHSSTVRTLWPISRPISHKICRNCSPDSAKVSSIFSPASSSSRRIIRSMSEEGCSSFRPYPPTAIRLQQLELDSGVCTECQILISNWSMNQVQRLMILVLEAPSD
ncbi:hypothetical protein BMS3Bbin11_01274 [bacterium BMS3Bbin11]|nr:hypothetical protein BMS3Bbin11_01274 [bacterium BMS3Bbin11]